MNNSELISQESRILNLITITESSYEPDDEMSSHLAKYICILCSGFLENAVYHIFKDYSESKSTSENLQRFIDETLSNINNPNSDKLRRILKMFDPEWENSARAFMVENGRSEALSAIIKNRNRIAHGNDSDITIGRIKEYFNKAVETFEFIENQCETCVK